MPMTLYLCDFRGYWVRGRAIVRATSRFSAIAKLLASLPEELKAKNSRPQDIEVVELTFHETDAVIICDGDV